MRIVFPTCMTGYQAQHPIDNQELFATKSQNIREFPYTSNPRLPNKTSMPCKTAEISVKREARRTMISDDQPLVSACRAVEVVKLLSYTLKPFASKKVEGFMHQVVGSLYSLTKLFCPERLKQNRHGTTFNGVKSFICPERLKQLDEGPHCMLLNCLWAQGICRELKNSGQHTRLECVFVVSRAILPGLSF